MPPSEFEVPLTVLPSKAGEEDAVCLDGSPPAYHISRGWGQGAQRWLVFLEGGAWCGTVAACLRRARTRLGSSRRMDHSIPFTGILSNSSETNPYFFDWNIVYLRYCGGASFAGTASEGVPGARVHFTGQDVFVRTVEQLLGQEGLRHATHALLGGCSAGGLAALLHCDLFRDMILTASGWGTSPSPSPSRSSSNHSSQWTEAPGSAGAGATEVSRSTSPAVAPEDSDLAGPGKGDRIAAKVSSVPQATTPPEAHSPPVVKCLSDGGFFLDSPDIHGRYRMRSVFASVVHLHRPVLNAQCLEAQRRRDRRGDEDTACFFPENFLRYVSTPFFILNPMYDDHMLPGVYVTSPRGNKWAQCMDHLKNCRGSQLNRLHEYRAELLHKVQAVLKTKSPESTGLTESSANSEMDRGGGPTNLVADRKGQLVSSEAQSLHGMGAAQSLQGSRQDQAQSGESSTEGSEETSEQQSGSPQQPLGSSALHETPGLHMSPSSGWEASGTERSGGALLLDGAFLSSCWGHCQALMPRKWHGTLATRVQNRTAAEAVGAWFFAQHAANSVSLDCRYPCNPTCHDS